MSNTDDLEAMAREFLQARNLIALVPAEENEESKLLVTMLAAFARSLAHPPSSDLVAAGNAMCALLCLFYKESAASLPAELRKNLVDLVNAWEKAAAHPKDPAPTLERIMEEFEKSVEAATEPGDDDDAQDWIDINEVRTELSTRLKTLFP